MKTAEEILLSHTGGDGDMFEMAIAAMKDYARQVTYFHLNLAAEELYGMQGVDGMKEDIRSVKIETP